MTAILDPYKRIAIKIGSALLVDPARGLKSDWLTSLAADIAGLRKRGKDILIISSGAIAMGRTVLEFPARTLKLEESQAAAAAGQIALAHAWNAAFSAHGITMGQILLTLDDTESRRRYLNARATMSALLKLGAIPVINENDTVATNEIRYGDNDRLAARVSTMMGADLLVLLSDVDGLYSAPPSRDPGAEHFATIADIDEEIEAMAGDSTSALARGGMRTKVDAAKIATRSGTAMIITKGSADNPLAALDRGARHTLFKPARQPVSAWKNWIAGHLETQGRVLIDDGAIDALRSGKSLLPAGVKSVEGQFSRGDTVIIADVSTGREVARGLAAYEADEGRKIAGRKTSEIEAVLGYAPRTAMVHRDDLVLTPAAPSAKPGLT